MTKNQCNFRKMNKTILKNRESPKVTDNFFFQNHRKNFQRFICFDTILKYIFLWKKLDLSQKLHLRDIISKKLFLL